jgi:hypothetical protein
MKKLIIVALSAVLAVMAVEPAHAQDQKVLAIIDTAIDSSRPEFKDKIIYEACFTENRSCANKTSSTEGSGSANSPVWPASISNATYHGHNMTQAALAINPNIKIVFVRIADISAAGNSGQQPASLSSAIEWVSKNASKFSIDAVSISQSGTSKNNLLACSSDTKTINAVASLNAQNVPTFAATGNNGSTTMVGFPSCVSGVVGVGSVKPNLTELSTFTNRGIGLDIIAQGQISIKRYNGSTATEAGTSVSTQIAASLYIKNSGSLGFNNFLNGLPKVLGYTYISN